MIKNQLTSYRKVIFSILLSSLVLSLAIPFGNGAVSAQMTKGEHTVYLPLVSKNYQEWLSVFNEYRRLAGLNPVVSNDGFNDGLSLHVDYLLDCPQQRFESLHLENVCSGGTTIGAQAGGQSNMLWTDNLNYTQKQAIDLWMEYFDENRIEKIMNHRYHMLHPKLSQSGFSLKCDQTNCFAGLNIFGGLTQFESKETIEVIFPSANQQNVPPKRYGITWGFYREFTTELTEDNEVTLISSKITSPDGVVKHEARQPIKGNGYDYVNQIALYPDISFLPDQEYTIDITIVIDKGDPIRKVWSFRTAPIQ